MNNITLQVISTSDDMVPLQDVATLVCCRIFRAPRNVVQEAHNLARFLLAFFVQHSWRHLGWDKCNRSDDVLKLLSRMDFAPFLVCMLFVDYFCSFLIYEVLILLKKNKREKKKNNFTEQLK